MISGIILGNGLRWTERGYHCIALLAISNSDPKLASRAIMVCHCNTQLMPHRMTHVLNEPILEIQKKGSIDIRTRYLASRLELYMCDIYDVHNRSI